MIVDSFTAIGGYQVRPFDLGIDQWRVALDRNGVDKALVMSLRAVQNNVARGNNDIFELAKSDPRVLPVAALDPRRHVDVEQIIDDAVSNAAVALAFHMTAIPYPLSSIVFRRVLKCAVTSNKPLIFVTNVPGELTAIAEMTRDMGCAKVLLAGCNYGRITEMLALLEEFDHIHVETSWQIIPRSIELLCRPGGTGRVLFGSMAPLRPVRPALNMIADARLTNGEKADVLARSVLRFIGREQDAAAVEDATIEVLGTPAIPAIDVHSHVGMGSEIPVPCLSLDDAEKERQRFNIEFSIVSCTAAYKDDMNVGNQEMLETIETSQCLRGSVVVNPHHLNDSIKWLDVAVNDPRILHVTVHPATTYERFDGAGWMNLFAQIAARGLPLFYNTLGQDVFRRSPAATQTGHLMRLRGASSDEVDMFKQIDERFPEMPVIIGHGHGEEGLELARTCSNIYLELCSSYPEQNVYRRAIDLVGAERIVFGTDLEAFSPAFTLGILWEADLSGDEQRKILRDNACRILKLSR